MSGKASRVAVVTSEDFLDLDDSWPLLRDALAVEGLEPSVAVWNDPTAGWRDVDLILASYVWGYVLHRREFVEWAYQVAAHTRLVNSAPVLEWGSDKTYLIDLIAQKVPVVPTVWIRAGDRWHPPSDDYVIKPSVASGGMGAARYVDQGVEHADRHVRQLLAAGQTVMIQPYQSAVDVEGETALIYLGGNYSHAVGKEALLRSDVGVIDRLWEQQTISHVSARDDQRLLAEKAMHAVAQLVGSTTYARVDMVDSAEGSPLVLEVEVVEPNLFLTHCPEASGRLASLLRQLCD
jgi:glutathione synthase/RimK-type ligase-like ATP-grasp enzyme